MPFIAARRRNMLALALLLLAVPQGMVAQSPAGGALSSRSDLQAALEKRENWAASPTYSAKLRQQAQREAQALRVRLDEGDFRVGDRLIVRVEGAVPFSDTVTVQAGPRIVVPGLAATDVGGVLRAELQQRLQANYRQTVLDATVTVQPLARVAVFGTVGNPGYQLVPFESRVDELLTAAGGPVGDTRPDRFSIMRADTVLVDADGVAMAIASGRTIGDLSLRDGDYLIVKPVSPPWDRTTVISLVGIFVAPLLTTLLLR